MGGTRLDGTGNSWFYGDVAKRGDRIAKIAPAGVLSVALTSEIMGEGDTEAPAKTGRFAAPHGFAAWLNAMQERGTSVKGMAQGEPTREEIGTMQTLVRQAMEDGAFGIASALIYPPGNYATTHELGEIPKEIGKRNWDKVGQV